MPAMPLPTTTSRSRSDMCHSLRPAAAIDVRGPFDSDRRLLVVRLARERIERALCHLVRVRLGVVERHEQVPWRNRLRDTHFDTADPPASRDDVDAVLRFYAQRTRVARVHLHPGVRR